MSKPLIFGSGVSSLKDLSGLTEVCRTAIASGIRYFDTAPSYRTEQVLCEALRLCLSELGLSREDLRIQTKIDPIQMYEGNVEEYFKGKLKKMGLEYVDALLIHWPVGNYLRKTWESLLRLKEEGCAHKVGICNLRLPHLLELEGIGIVPEILQIERHPLNTFEREAAFCRQRGILLQDYSPLCKMHERIRESAALREIALRHGRDLGQIVLRWHIDTGATPVFTSTKQARVALYSHIDEFALSREEIGIISSLNVNHKLYLESLVCPGF
ncbi:MAG: aldo/keto reductase [Prevotellaceae bacterium]|nr:aldo/keto reductase [Prevotellaceae bacterium]